MQHLLVEGRAVPLVEPGGDVVEDRDERVGLVDVALELVASAVGLAGTVAAVERGRVHAGGVLGAPVLGALGVLQRRKRSRASAASAPRPRSGRVALELLDEEAVLMLSRRRRRRPRPAWRTARVHSPVLRSCRRSSDQVSASLLKARWSCSTINHRGRVEPQVALRLPQVGACREVEMPLPPGRAALPRAWALAADSRRCPWANQGHAAGMWPSAGVVEDRPSPCRAGYEDLRHGVHAAVDLRDQLALLGDRVADHLHGVGEPVGLFAVNAAAPSCTPHAEREDARTRGWRAAARASTG